MNYTDDEIKHKEKKKHFFEIYFDAFLFLSLLVSLLFLSHFRFTWRMSKKRQIELSILMKHLLNIMKMISFRTSQSQTNKMNRRANERKRRKRKTAIEVFLHLATSIYHAFMAKFNTPYKNEIEKGKQRGR